MPCSKYELESFKKMLKPLYERHNKNNNIPSHYKQKSTETIEVIKRMAENCEGVEAFIVGNIIKYLDRYKYKNGVEDLKKARHYIDMLIKLEEKGKETNE